MPFNERQRLILIGILQDQKRLAAMSWGDDHNMSRDALGRHRLRIHQAREGLVQMALEDWIGRRPTNSEHVLFHRACVQLEALGLIERHNFYGGRRTTHLRLTPAGRRAAEQLLFEEYGLEAGGSAETIDWSKLELIEVPPGTDKAVNDAQ